MCELAPWRSPLARALHRNRSLPHLKFVQLATVDHQGHPHNRTVVYRGMLENSNDLTFITDHRSEKIQHLEFQPMVEVCWYFTKTREQFRFSGKIYVIRSGVDSNTPSSHLIRAWEKLSNHAQSQFYWPTPGAPRSPDTDFNRTAPSPGPPENFVLLQLKVQVVEHLQLRGDPQQRDRYVQSHSNWTIEAINP